jgi:hypothetical protein
MSETNIGLPLFRFNPEFKYLLPKIKATSDQLSNLTVSSIVTSQSPGSGSFAPINTSTTQSSSSIVLSIPPIITQSTISFTLPYTR